MGNDSRSADGSNSRSQAASSRTSTFRESTAAGHSLSGRAQRREAARLGWQRRRAAGYTPRGRAAGPRRIDRQQAIALAYPQQQPSRRRLIQLYLQATGGEEVDGRCMRGARTFAEIIRQDWRLARVRGQYAASTAPRRARGLRMVGRGRVERTVRRHRSLAAKIGVARYRHVRQHGATPGSRDYLRIELLTVPKEMSTCLRQHHHGPLGLSGGAPAKEAQTKHAQTTVGEAGPAPPQAAQRPTADRDSAAAKLQQQQAASTGDPEASRGLDAASAAAVLRQARYEQMIAQGALSEQEIAELEERGWYHPRDG